ncbi:regulator of gene activity-like [Teleopsis dalmanni]|uniref:regulator of gene activity-like n=1 Tax=Teleopsis dalmanni TaxID=139649 RepID=UPI0018CCAEFB|nr:regulator of gene activity-like [Teleopsis dalmanni]
MNPPNESRKQEEQSASGNLCKESEELPPLAIFHHPFKPSVMAPDFAMMHSERSTKNSVVSQLLEGMMKCQIQDVKSENKKVISNVEDLPPPLPPLPEKRTVSGSSMVNDDSSHPTVTIDGSGEISNIPPNVLTDSYGILELQRLLEKFKRNPESTHLGMGIDLTKIGIDVMSDKPIIEHFNIDLDNFFNPVNTSPNEQTKSFNEPLNCVDVRKMTEEVLFYNFCSTTEESVRVMVTTELLDRNWRFHCVIKCWLQLIPGEIYVYDGPTISGTFKVLDELEYGVLDRYFVININDLGSTELLH